MYIRKLLVGAMLVFALILACGISVSASESGVNSDAGYINDSNVRLRTAGNLNAKVITKLSRGTKLTILGLEDEWYRVIHNGNEGFVFNEFVTLGEPEPTTAPNQPAVNGDIEMLDWWEDVQDMMKGGSTATVTDVSTGIQFQIRIMSTGSHADVEPLTADDTAKMSQTRGGKWSWSPRAILVTLENGRTIAASANSMPHGGSSISNNNFSGHFCIHFLNSRNHYNNRVDAGHQAQVNKAFQSFV